MAREAGRGAGLDWLRLEMDGFVAVCSVAPLPYPEVSGLGSTGENFGENSGSRAFLNLRTDRNGKEGLLGRKTVTICKFPPVFTEPAVTAVSGQSRFGKRNFRHFPKNTMP